MEVNDDFIELALEMASEKDEKIELKDYHQDYGNASALFPKTRSEMAFSSFHGRLSLEYYRIEHVTRFELFSFLSGQLGIRAFKQGNIGQFDISPRLDLSLTSRLSLEMLFGKNTSGLGFYYKFKDSFTAGFFAGKTREIFCLDLEARYNHSKTSKVSFGLGSVFEHFLLSYEKKFECGSICLYIKEVRLNTVFGFKGKWKVLQDLNLVYCANQSEAAWLNRQGLGLQMRFGEHLKIENFIEEHANSWLWAVTIKRGGFSLRFPIRLQKLSRFISLFGICVFAYVARGLFSSFFKGNEDKKVLKQKEFSIEFIRMVEGKVRENMQAEEMKEGLVVIKGLFGKEEDIRKSLENNSEGLYIDVTIPLNFMVDDSKLKIPSQKKETLQGFYFVCEKSVLFIQYKIRGENKEVFIGNTQELIIS